MSIALVWGNSEKPFFKNCVVFVHVNHTSDGVGFLPFLLYYFNMISVN